MNWVIMPFQNCWDLTEAAARDVLAQTLPDTRLLLINNGSGQEAREACHRFTAHEDRILSWTWTPAYPSLAATWNRALQFVWAAGGQTALVVNNDVRLPKGVYEALAEVQQKTGAWFVSACNVEGPAWYDGMLYQWTAVTDSLLASRGGPDFSCYLITRACHQWFQFDEAFQPAYHEDNDYHRRLQLAGFGDRIFSVCVPYRHLGSATINQSPQYAAAFKAKFERCQQVYRDKWGGLPGAEIHEWPHGIEYSPLAFPDARVILFGQGRGELTLDHYRQIAEHFYGQETI